MFLFLRCFVIIVVIIIVVVVVGGGGGGGGGVFYFNISLAVLFRYSPEVNPVSSAIDKQVLGGEGSTEIRLARIMKKAEEAELRRAIVKRELLEKELAECTFHPQTSPPRNSSSSLNRSSGDGSSERRSSVGEEDRYESSDDGSGNRQEEKANSRRFSKAAADLFARRNEEWVKRREDRIDMERRMLKEREMEEVSCGSLYLLTPSYDVLNIFYSRFDFVLCFSRYPWMFM